MLAVDPPKSVTVRQADATWPGVVVGVRDARTPARRAFVVLGAPKDAIDSAIHAQNARNAARLVVIVFSARPADEA